jgi:hypothetical protein
MLLNSVTKNTALYTYAISKYILPVLYQKIKLSRGDIYTEEGIYFILIVCIVNRHTITWTIIFLRQVW